MNRKHSPFEKKVAEGAGWTMYDIVYSSNEQLNGLVSPTGELVSASKHSAEVEVTAGGTNGTEAVVLYVKRSESEKSAAFSSKGTIYFFTTVLSCSTLIASKCEQTMVMTNYIIIFQTTFIILIRRHTSHMNTVARRMRLSLTI
jgi:hypothetical protein